MVGYTQPSQESDYKNTGGAIHNTTYGKGPTNARVSRDRDGGVDRFGRGK